MSALHWEPALLSLALVLVVCNAPPRVRRWLLPPQRDRAMPWNGVDVVIVLILIQVLWPKLVGDTLKSSGFFQWIYGPDFGVEPLAAADRTRMQVWLATFTAPLQVGSILLILWEKSDARLYQIGLTTHRWKGNIALGVLAWLVLTPALYTLLGVLEQMQPSEEHPLTRLSRAKPFPGEWLLIFSSAVLIAPILEELLFRGLLQRFLAKREWGGYAALAASLAMILLQRGGRLMKLKEDLPPPNPPLNLPPMVIELAPFLFFALALPGFFYLSHWRKSQKASAIYATALLFGCMHTFAWPTPIPLFLLGLALGWMAERTQSLVGPIVCHVLFNSLASIILLTNQGAKPPENGKEETATGRRPAVSSASSFVPGSWHPRRM